MSILNNSLLLGADAGAGGYQISRSLRFNSSDSAYLSRTPSSAGNRKTWTWSGWVKRSGLGTDQVLLDCRPVTSDSQFTIFYLKSTNTLEFSGPVTTWRTTTQLFRDTSAWYHILIALDTTQATAADRIKIYVNGSQVTDFATSANPSQNADLGINQAALHGIGASSGGSPAAFLNGYLADVHFIDGQALTPSSFTEVSATTGQLIPKAYTGSFGTNGFWLKFSDNSAATATTLGKDYSGNNNNWTPNNLSVTAGAGNDSLVDTPTSYGTDTGAGGEVRGNYCTWNPLSLLASATTSNGNLDASTPTANGGGVFGTIAFPASGKWYFEVTPTTGNSAMIGISDYLSTSSNAWAISPSVFYWSNGKKYVNGSDGGTYGATYTANDVIGVAVNCDSGSITFYKNNSSQGSISCSPGGLYPCLTDGTGSTGDSFSANFGQRPFAYTAPSGFKALCDTNLPAPVVAKPSTVMDVALWSGTGATQSITFQSGLSPDFVWIKARNAVANHVAFDVVRGANKAIYPSLTNAEDTYTATLTSFNSSGFTLGYDDWSGVNQSGRTYVAWAWDAGSSTVTNTQGSITSQVRANASAGFSIVAWTGNSTVGATVGHGLGAKPFLRIIKRRDAASTIGWMTFHESAPTSYFTLNSTNAATPASEAAPTSTVFSLPSDANSNANGGTYVAYCFAPVAGYSAFGSYTGNGSTDGPFVYLGFRPAVVLVKMSSSTGDWTILDDKREGYNVDNDPLYPNLSNAEGTTDLIDITSNGFKVRTTDATFNTSAGTYVYAAWASSPFAYSRAR